MVMRLTVCQLPGVQPRVPGAAWVPRCPAGAYLHTGGPVTQQAPMSTTSLSLMIGLGPEITS